MNKTYVVHTKHIPMVGGAEYDAFTGWRHLLHFRPGERKALKRKYHRRWRKQTRNALAGYPSSDL